MDMISLRRNVIAGAASSLTEYTITGNPVAFTTQLAKPVKSITVPLSYTQEGSGDPSPDNIRPISGVSSLFCVHAKKNMGYLWGYSAANVRYEVEGVLSNNYGTTLSTTSPESSVTITQSDATTDYGKSNYRNGYFSIRTDNMVEGQRYDVSLKVTDITSNPLDASLYDWMIMPGQGSGGIPSEVKDNVLIFKNLLYREYVQYYRQGWEVRNCGMSCTVSEFMITPANTNDGVYEPYDGAKLDVTFPAVGKNLFDKSTGIELTENNILVARHDGYGVPFHMTAGTTYIIYTNSSTNPNEISLRVPFSTTKIAISYTQNTGYMTYTSEEDVDVALNAYFENGRPEDATDLMIETGSKTAYEPYNNSVYGGSLDLVSGALTIDSISATFKISDYTDKTAYTDITLYDFRNVWDKPVVNNNHQICSIAKYSWNGETRKDDHFYIYTMNDSPRLMLYLVGTVDETQEFTVVAPVETPFTIQLDPRSVTAIKGTNTIWTDTTGDLTIKYLDKA